MKIARFAFFALVVSVAIATLAGCDDEKPRVVGTPVTVHERLVDTVAGTVREVEFVTVKKEAGRTAVTRVRLTDEKGLASMVNYDFDGYHPEVVVGLKAKLIRTYSWLSSRPNEGRYYSTFCVEVESGQICMGMLEE